MKKRALFTKAFGKKNIILAAVALVLVGTTAMGSTISWIEEVSEVKFNNTKGQQTPAKIGGKILDSDIASRENIVDANITESAEITTISLDSFFNKSGDIHLSPCYGDGEKFYFPVEQYTGDSVGFREGTKDDVNVNYLSATFKLRSLNENTVYWFAQAKETGGGAAIPYVKFKNGGSDNAAFQKYLRCSVTVDGATNVYSLNDTANDENNTVTYDKTYKTLEGDAIIDNTGRSFEQFTYCDVEDTGSVVTCVRPNPHAEAANQGSGSNLNGNTLFSVNKYDANNKEGTIKTITVKIWLECPTTGQSGSYVASNVSDIDIADININLVSSWSKTRRIYLHDVTVDEFDSGLSDNPADQHTGTQWLSNSNAKLYWALEDSNSQTGYTPFAVKPVPTDGSDPNKSMVGIADTVPGYVENDNDGHWYYVDLPAVYTNRKAALFRCDGAWNSGRTHTENGKTIYYWDKWDTTFPDTYHSEVFTVFSHQYATWDGDNTKYVSFVDSIKLKDLGLTPKAYLWDSATVYDVTDVNAKVVKNADWPGAKMTKLWAKAGNMNLDTYQFFYQSKFDMAVFNDGVMPTEQHTRNQLQTQDLVLRTGNQNWEKKYFDMATLSWYDSTSDLPTYTDCILVNNFNENGSEWSHIRMVYYTNNAYGTNQNQFMCKAFIKSAGSFKLKIWDSGANTHYGKPDGWHEWLADHEDTMRNIGDNGDGYVVDINVTQEMLDNSGNGVFRFYYNNSTHKFKWQVGESG